MNPWRSALAVFRKEWLDAMRDRRTLLVVLVSAVLIGPLALLALSGLIASLEAKAEQRELVVAGIGYAPSLRNYAERQTWTLREAPSDYEQRLKDSKLGDPVLVIAKDFEAELLRGDSPEVELVSHSANPQSQAGARRVAELLRGFNQERVGLTLALRGVALELLTPMKVQEVDLANMQARAAQFTGMVALIVLLAVVSGALNAALDSTAGERERGSLEPLLMNPVTGMALVLGKWGAVAAVSMLVAVLSCLSFLPSQWLLRSENLQAMFQFGWTEMALFLVLLLPFAAAISAMLMAVAIRCKSYKEAQANSTVVMMAVMFLAYVPMFNQTGEEPWHLWVPALAQNSLMLRVLKGEGLTAQQWLVPLFVCALLSTLCLWFVARRLRGAAVK